MKRLFLLLILSFILCLQTTNANSILKETYKYASKDGIELMLDKYEFNDSIENKPCVIFLFGGGFVNGKRDNDKYLPYFQSLAKNGNIVVSIDYRLGLKNLNFQKLSNEGVEAFLNIFVHTLNIATEDLIAATQFVLDNAVQWNIDKSKIIASGSSAGAVTALHAEYAICNRQAVAQQLPEDFRYAGIISLAGAVFSINGDLVWDSKPAPTLFFHGNADGSVPYNAVTMGPVGFYGSKYISNQFEDMKVPYYFYDEEFGTHALASTPMTDKLEIINSFISNEVVNRANQRVHTIVKFNDRDSLQTEFTILDYLLNNFKPKGID